MEIDFLNRILLEKISDYNKSWGINLWKDTRNDLLILTRESLKKNLNWLFKINIIISENCAALERNYFYLSLDYFYIYKISELKVTPKICADGREHE